MPDFEIIQFFAVLGSFVLLIASFKYKVCIASAYFSVIVTRPGLYYPFLRQIRFELVFAIIALLFILFSRERHQYLNPGKSKTLRYLYYLILIIFLSMIQAFNFTSSWEWIYSQVLPATLLTFLLLLFCRDQKDIKIFLWVFCIYTFYLCYEPVFSYLAGDLVFSFGDFDYAVGKKGLVANHNSLANYSLQAMPFLWYLSVISKKKIVKIVGFGLLAFCCYAVILSGSRGGAVGFVALSLLMVMFAKRPVFMLTAALSVIVAALIFMGDKYFGRMATILEGTGSGMSAASRLDGLIHGIEMMIKRPILGVGPGCYPIARKAWFSWSLWAHNHYGQLAGELGLTGVIIWGRFAYEYIKSSWKISKSSETEPFIKAIATAIIITSGVSLVLGMATHSLYKLIWYIMAALVVVLEDITRQNNMEFSTAGSSKT